MNPRMLLLPLLISACTLTVHAETRELRAGAYAMDVTPQKFPTALSGGFLPVVSTKVLDPLHARCLVLDDGATRIGICILDNCLFHREFGDAARKGIADATGIPIENLTVACTHNHSSPALMDCHGAVMDADYAAWLLPKLAEGMREAVARLQPARVGWSVTQTWDHAFNRRWVRRPDRVAMDPFGERTARVHMNPGHQSSDVIGPSGPKDPDLTFLAVETRDGRPLCVLANFANHYFGVGGAVVSADYFSRFGHELNKLLHRGEAAAEFVGIMSQGTSGDINRLNFAEARDQIQMDNYARDMAELAYAAYKKIEFKDWAPVAMRTRDIEFATRVPDASRLAWARGVVDGLEGRAPRTSGEIYAGQQLWLAANPRATSIVQAIRVGDLGMVTASAEVYAISGLKIKAQSPFDTTFWITLANGNDGYIPPPAQFPLGGYTTWPTRTSSLETNAEPVIVENLLQLLEQISGRTRRPVQEPHGPYAMAVLAANPFAYWRLNDFDSRVARDASGHGRHAQFGGGICTYLPGIEPTPGFTTVQPTVPNAFSGGAINRAVHVVEGSVEAELDNLNDFSVEFWFWNGLPFDARGTTGELLRTGNVTVQIGGTNAVPGILEVLAGGRPAPLEMMPLRLRAWHQLVLVKERDQGRLYLDSSKVSEWRWEAGLPSKLVLGGGQGSHAPFEGKLDEAAVYARSLSVQEISGRHALAF